MTFLDGLDKEVHQRALVIPVLGVGQLGEVGDVEPDRLLVPGAGVHDVAHQQNQLEDLPELVGPANLQ